MLVVEIGGVLHLLKSTDGAVSGSIQIPDYTYRNNVVSFGGFREILVEKDETLYYLEIVIGSIGPSLGAIGRHLNLPKASLPNNSEFTAACGSSLYFIDGPDLTIVYNGFRKYFKF